MNRSLLVLFIPILLFSCSSRNEPLLNRLENIKEKGNVYPLEALSSLDSIEPELSESSEYTKKKYELLRIRLQDKADVIATSDSTIKQLVAYFVGNDYQDDLQEVYYYAGSVYRDMQDSPNALRYFLESEYQAKKITHPDSLMLRNTYSQLYLVYYRVQDYKNALRMAREEARIANELGVLDARTIYHEGASLVHLDCMEQALSVFKETLDCIERDGNNTGAFYKELIPLLYHFSLSDSLDQARKCYDILLNSNTPYQLVNDYYDAFGTYYLACNRVDSAKFFFQKGVELGPRLENRYSSAKRLFFLYKAEGNLQSANDYADVFIKLNDSLNLGQRQELAATVNNQFKYYKNEEEERQLKEANERNRSRMIITVASSLIVLLLLLTFVIYLKNKSLKVLLSKDFELGKLKTTNQKLQEEIAHQEQELTDISRKHRVQEKELVTMREKVKAADVELELTRDQLEDRMAQNKKLLKMLNQSTFEENARDISRKVKLASKGQYKMEAADWATLRSSIDEIFPTFGEKVLRFAGTNLSEQNLRFCYLMSMGLSNSEIEHVMDLSRATVWRWANKYSWIIDEMND
jgi:tetratricopeptide (TPR) repeat protein